MRASFMPLSGPYVLQVTQQTVNQIQGSLVPTWGYNGLTQNPASCPAGCFTADAPNSSNTTVIQISSVNQGGDDSSWMQAVPNSGAMLLICNARGNQAAYGLQSIVAVPEPDQPEAFMMSVNFLGGSFDWSGNYSVNFQPAAQ
jgi:hypothetical protein